MLDPWFPNAGEFYSTLCALLWASGVILFKKSGESVPPVALNLFKDVVGMLLFLAVILFFGLPITIDQHPLNDWCILLLSGAIGIGLADTLFFASLNRIGAGRSAIVDCLYSPFIILCSFFFLEEKIGISLLLSLALMIIGIIIGTWKPENTACPAERRKIFTGVMLGVLSMLLMAVSISMAKPVLDRSDPWWATTVRLAGGIALLAVQGATRRNRGSVWRCFRPGPHWKVVVPAAILGGFLAMFFWIAGMKYTDTTIASVLNQLSTIFVLFFATLFLKEPLTKRKIAAILLGFGGGVIAAL
ncbi:MAG TPA: DMT family transporter [Myxococcota bacterium]|nr:DMT family transporter [Myxococcota bacterium]